MRAAVLGRPVGHSLSPVLHTAAYAALGLSDWSYTAVDCGEQELPGLLAGLGPEWAGLSLTTGLLHHSTTAESMSSERLCVLRSSSSTDDHTACCSQIDDREGAIDGHRRRLSAQGRQRS